MKKILSPIIIGMLMLISTFANAITIQSELQGFATNATSVSIKLSHNESSDPTNVTVEMKAITGSKTFTPTTPIAIKFRMSNDTMLTFSTTSLGELDEFTIEIKHSGTVTETRTLSKANPLPVELVSFTGSIKNDQINLNWVTASEKNSSHFVVERSFNGLNFESMGTVKAAGNTSTTQKYSFLINTVNNGINYFRLKQVDLDGSFEYSKIISLNTNAGNNMYLTINGNLVKTPAKVSEPLYEVVITNLLGQIIYTTKSLTPVTLNYRGIGFITVYTDKNAYVTRIFVK